jgi:hypothetical protein
MGAPKNWELEQLDALLEAALVKAACAAIGWTPPLGPKAVVPPHWQWAVPKEES